MIKSIKNKLPHDFNKQIIFEVISHRYTTRAKNIINEVFPDDRKFKYGQFGYGKYVYSKEELTDMKEFFMKEIKDIFPNSVIKYVI